MELNINKPIAFFDLETTGLSITNDRIVEISILKVMPNGEQEKICERLNPEMPISAEASSIHGIYEKDIKDSPTFKERAKFYEQFLKGCDLGGYNLLKFDIPVLVEEFLRYDIEFKLDSRKVVDVQRIFYMMEPRTLSAAYKFYCDKSLENAHSAEADTIATYEVLKAQIERYEGVTIKDNKDNEYSPIKNDIQALHDVSATKFADLVGRIAYNDEGVEVFNFGKHKNRPVADVFKKEPGYYDWMMRGDFALSTKRKLTEIKLKMLQN